MWKEKIEEKNIDEFLTKETKNKINKVLKGNNALHLMESDETKPYLQGIEVRVVSKYNPAYGNDKECECGHSYYRHFDSYEDMDPCGCKYCGCYDFKEKK